MKYRKPPGIFFSPLFHPSEVHTLLLLLMKIVEEDFIHHYQNPKTSRFFCGLMKLATLENLALLSTVLFSDKYFPIISENLDTALLQE